MDITSALFFFLYSHVIDEVYLKVASHSVTHRPCSLKSLAHAKAENVITHFIVKCHVSASAKTLESSVKVFLNDLLGRM